MGNRPKRRIIMCSYFDQFIVIQIFHPLISDSLLIVFCALLVIYFLNKSYIIPTRIQSVIEIIIDH